MQNNSICLGDMYWGKSEKYPWWPCVILRDLKGEYTRFKRRTGYQYHVQFIGPEYDVCWITDEFLTKYEGEKQLEGFIEEKQRRSTPNSKQIYSMHMSADIKVLWQSACAEARIIYCQDANDRIKSLPQSEVAVETKPAPKASHSKVKSKSAKRTSSETLDSDLFAVKRDRNSAVCNTSTARKLSEDELARDCFIKRETDHLLQGHSTKNSETLATVLAQQWEVLDAVTKQLYCLDAEKELQRQVGRPGELPSSSLQQSKVSGRKIKVPSRLRSLCPSPEETTRPPDTKRHSQPTQTPTLRSPDQQVTTVVAPATRESNSPPQVPDLPISQPHLVQVNSVYKETMDLSILRKVIFKECLTEMMKIIITDVNYLPENACYQCFRVIEPNTKYVRCNGKCQAKYHFHCAVLKKLFRSDDVYRCIHCLNRQVMCCICKNSKYMKKQLLLKCQKDSCSVQFHPTCLKFLYLMDHNVEDYELNICPSHSCLTCYREDSKHPCHTQGTLVSCIKCPATFHANNVCIPAGSRMLIRERMICHRHNEVTPSLALSKITRCFVCFDDNATLRCCRCQAVFHPKCMSMPTYTDLLKDYICPSCKLEKPLFHGEVVWVSYRPQSDTVDTEPSEMWRPAEIMSPGHVPREYIDLERRCIYVQLIGTEIYLPLSRCDIVPFVIGLAVLQPEPTSCNPDLISRAKKMHICYGNWRKRLFPYTSQKMTIIGQADLLHNSISNSSLYLKTDGRGYQKIKTNVISLQVKRGMSGSVKMAPPEGVCVCAITGLYCATSACRNVALRLECDLANCLVRTGCTNRRFVAGFFQPLYVTDSGVIEGTGTMITGNASKGSLIGELVGRVIGIKEVLEVTHSRGRLESVTHIFQLVDDLFIDCGQYGNDFRYLNHSCAPNCQLVCWRVSGQHRLGVLTLRCVDDEELTIDYRECRAVLKFGFLCKCGSNDCAEVIGPSSVFAGPTSFLVPRCCVTNNTFSTDAVARTTTVVAVAAAAPAQSMEMLLPKKPVTEPIVYGPGTGVADSHCSKTRCQSCSGSGELLACSRDLCQRRYHLSCLELASAPRGFWYCPLHFCDVCGAPSHVFCSFCPASHCQAHVVQQKSHDCKIECAPPAPATPAPLALPPAPVPPLVVTDSKDKVYRGCDLVKVDSASPTVFTIKKRSPDNDSVCSIEKPPTSVGDGETRSNIIAVKMKPVVSDEVFTIKKRPCTEEGSKSNVFSLQKKLPGKEMAMSEGTVFTIKKTRSARPGTTEGAIFTIQKRPSCLGDGQQQLQHNPVALKRIKLHHYAPQPPQKLLQDEIYEHSPCIVSELENLILSPIVDDD